MLPTVAEVTCCRLPSIAKFAREVGLDYPLACFFTQAHRANAACRALSRRCVELNFFALALPPLRANLTA